MALQTSEYSHARSESAGGPSTSYQPTINAEAGPSNPSTSQIQSADTTAPIDPTLLPGSRPPRSRKNRPCDHCRRSKSRCAIGPTGPPCVSCKDSTRPCTFDFAPPSRPARVKPTPDAPDSSMGDALGSEYKSPSVAEERLRGNGLARPSGRISETVTSAVPSFDNLTTSGYEPHVLTVVLTDDLFPITNINDAVGQGDPHVRQISSDPTRPIYVIMNPRADPSQQPVPGAVGLGLLRSFLRHHPGALPEPSLLSLYYEHVHPALPILPDDTTLSPVLLSMVMATSMSHSLSTRSIAAPSYAVLEAGSTPLPENNLAGVASAVLELGIRPINSSRSSYILLAKWAISAWEQELRIRLWWTLAVHDAWMSFLNSRPALIQANNNDIPLPTFTALIEASCSHGAASTDSAKSFIGSCKLALLVRRLQSNICTLDAVANTSNRERRDEVSAISNKADQLYDEWRDRAVGSRIRPTGVNSFLIHLLGFRCMLRRIHLELTHGLGSTFTPGPEILAPFTDCVTFVSHLTEADCDGYFLNYASHILSSVTSSLTRLTLASPSSPNHPAMNLLSILMRSLNHYQTAYNWDIAVPALRRAAAVEARLSSIGEHEALVIALRGGEAAMPFNLDALQTVASAQLPGIEADPQLVWDWSGLDWNFGDLLAGDLR